MQIPLGDRTVRWLTGYRCRRLGIFIGFASFFMMEKTLRVLGGEEEHGHSHSHSHSHSNGSVEHSNGHSNGHSTAVSAPSANGLKSRGTEKSDKHEANGNGGSGLRGTINHERTALFCDLSCWAEETSLILYTKLLFAYASKL